MEESERLQLLVGKQLRPGAIANVNGSQAFEELDAVIDLREPQKEVVLVKRPHGAGSGGERTFDSLLNLGEVVAIASVTAGHGEEDVPDCLAVDRCQGSLAESSQEPLREDVFAGPFRMSTRDVAAADEAMIVAESLAAPCEEPDVRVFVCAWHSVRKALGHLWRATAGVRREANAALVADPGR